MNSLTAESLLADVHMGQTLEEAVGTWLHQTQASRLVVGIDSRVADLYLERLSAAWGGQALVTVIPSGEVNKTLATCERLWQAWFEAGVDRDALVMAVGGGMTTDLVGFAARTWKRGLAFALVPTTLLAMVDATLGGKLGVDFAGGKNLLGTFAQPEAILIAPEFLRSLDTRELRSGLAEMLKHALLFDAEQWGILSALNLEGEIDWAPHIRRSLALKAEVVAADPLEKGVRALLNLGHTIGHAVESALLGTPHELRHGEAVALGLAAEAQLATRYTGLPLAQAEAIETGLRRLGYPLGIPPLDEALVSRLLLNDKKNVGHGLRMPLLERIGQARVGVEVSLGDALASLHSFYTQP